MTCEKLAEALIEIAAAGETPAGETANHLENCARCRATLEREQRLFAAIDGELRARLNAPPYAGFLAGMQARIAQRAQRESSWNPMGALAWAAVALVLVTLAHPWGGLRKQRVEQGLKAPATPFPLRADAGQPEQKTNRGTHLKNLRPRAKKQVLVQPVASHEPEVLVPPDEARAFAQFVARVAGRDERAEAVVRPMRGQAEHKVPTLDIADLQLEPLVDEAK